MLHWEDGISQSSPLKLQPPWGTCCADERDWEVGATDSRSEYFCLVTWCGSKKETLCHSLTWRTSHLRHFFSPQSHHSLYRVHLGGISEHLLYPESVPWYLHREFEEECKTSDHHFSMPAMKFWTHPCYGEVHPCEMSEMQHKIIFLVLSWLQNWQVYQLNHLRGSYGDFPAGVAGCGPKSILEATSAQHCRPAILVLRVWKTLTSVTVPSASDTELLWFPGA